MRYKKQTIVIASLTTIIAFIQCSKTLEKENVDQSLIEANQSLNGKKNKSLAAEGKEIFRYDSFGDEDFWTGLLHLDKAIAGEKNGGFGTGISPKAALSVGLKVDSEALPADVVA